VITGAPTPASASPDPNILLLTVEEAARRLGIGRTVCYRLISGGELESVTVGRLRKILALYCAEYRRGPVERGSTCGSGASWSLVLATWGATPSPPSTQ
jgi:excisionase family DNA binding protein